MNKGFNNYPNITVTMFSVTSTTVETRLRIFIDQGARHAEDIYAFRRELVTLINSTKTKNAFLMNNSFRIVVDPESVSIWKLDCRGNKVKHIATIHNKEHITP